MKWQDVVLALCTIGFSIALLPALFHTEKPAPLTSITTTFLLAVIAVVDFTLGLELAGCFTALTGGMWFILWAQGRRRSTTT